MDSVVLLPKINPLLEKTKLLNLQTPTVSKLFRKERRTVAGVVVFAKILPITSSDWGKLRAPWETLSYTSLYQGRMHSIAQFVLS